MPDKIKPSPTRRLGPAVWACAQPNWDDLYACYGRHCPLSTHTLVRSAFPISSKTRWIRIEDKDWAQEFISRLLLRAFSALGIEMIPFPGPLAQASGAVGA